MSAAGGRAAGGVAWRVALWTAAQIVLDALMLLAIIALWSPDAPPFIYVAF